MAKNLNWWSRKGHRWGAILTSIPMLLVITSGLVLQVKKQVAWVQPPTAKGQRANETPSQSWESILRVASAVPEAQIKDWSDIERLDIRPAKGIVKVLSQNHWEVQVDLDTGDVLSSTLRRSDVIESLHDGSFFSEAAKLWLFLPNGLVLLGLWLSGLWLWYLPVSKRSQRARKRQPPTQARPELEDTVTSS